MLDWLATGVALAGTWVGVRGVRLLLRGLRGPEDDRSSLDVIRGIRGVVVAVGTAALAAGTVFERQWLLAFGCVFLLEELYETGIVILILRTSDAGRPGRKNFSHRPAVAFASVMRAR